MSTQARAQPIFGSSNSAVLIQGMGSLVSVVVSNLSACSFTLYDSNISTGLAVMTSNAQLSGATLNILYDYKINLGATAGPMIPFSPSIPTFYRHGLFANVSGATNYTVL